MTTEELKTLEPRELEAHIDLLNIQIDDLIQQLAIKQRELIEANNLLK